MDEQVERAVIDGLPESFTLYVPFTRVSPDGEERREIIGVATKEVLDTHGTIISYDGSKKAFARWAGNIREQHDEKKAVGRALEWWPDDENKQIFVRAYISKGAEDTWTKIKEGVLTGFSIHGHSAKYTTIQRGKKSLPCIDEYDMSEVSVVDNPSCPVGPVAILRADGFVDGVLASDEELAALSNKAEQSVTQNEAGKQSFERSADSRLHSMRDQAMQFCNCDECSGMMSRSTGSETVMTEEMIQRFMAPVYARSQAMLSDFARRTEDFTTLSGAIERITATLERVATTEILDKVLAELAAVKGQVERVAATPMPGGPHTGRSANKHLATDGTASPSEETPELMRQINKAGVTLTPAQQTQLVASSLKRM